MEAPLHRDGRLGNGRAAGPGPPPLLAVPYRRRREGGCSDVAGRHGRAVAGSALVDGRRADRPVLQRGQAPGPLGMEWHGPGDYGDAGCQRLCVLGLSRGLRLGGGTVREMRASFLLRVGGELGGPSLLVGLLLFGAAVVREGTPSRVFGALLAVGAALAPVAILRDEFLVVPALMVAAGFAGMGWSLLCEGPHRLRRLRATYLAGAEAKGGETVLRLCKDREFRKLCWSRTICVAAAGFLGIRICSCSVALQLQIQEKSMRRGNRLLLHASRTARGRRCGPCGRGPTWRAGWGRVRVEDVVCHGEKVATGRSWGQGGGVRESTALRRAQGERTLGWGRAIRESPLRRYSDSAKYSLTSSMSSSLVIVPSK